MKQRIPVEKDPELKIEITQLSEAHPDWPGKSIRAALEKSPLFRDRVPSIRKIQDVVKKNAERKAGLREQAKTESYSLDEPWHMGALNNDKYYIPADVIPVILEIQKELDKNITIREVKWLAHLYKVVQKKFLLYVCAVMYAQHEQISEIAGLQYNSSKLDVMLPEFSTSIPMSYETLYIILMTIFARDTTVRQTEQWGQLVAQRMEEELIGHSISELVPLNEISYRLYVRLAQFVTSITGPGHWTGFSDKGKEAFLKWLREKTPEILEAFINENFDSALESFSQLFNWKGVVYERSHNQEE